MGRAGSGGGGQLPTFSVNIESIRSWRRNMARATNRIDEESALNLVSSRPAGMAPDSTTGLRTSFARRCSRPPAESDLLARRPTGYGGLAL